MNMALFEKFHDTVFLKSDSELEEKINALKQIRDKVKEKDEIDKEIKLAELGLAGERKIEYELKCANIGMYVLHDINLVADDLTAQIDWIIITPAYCYLVECKNLIGNVTVNNQGEFRRYYQYNGKKISEAIYSPFTQAVRHKEIWKKNWLARQNKLTAFLYQNTFDEWHKPLVVFANTSGILDIKYAPKNLKNNIVKVDNLVEYLKNDIRQKDSSELDKKKVMEELANNILNNLNVKIQRDYTSKYTIIETPETLKLSERTETVEEMIEEQVKDVQNNSESGDTELRERLIAFRKERSTSKKVPAYYVFTNDELERLVKYKPRSIEELNKLKILDSVKVKCHGNEIVEVITRNANV